jgi:hypothetical protein
MIHNGGLCIGCVTKRCSHNSTNVSYEGLVSRLFCEKYLLFCHFQNNIGFPMEGKPKAQTFCDTAVAKSTVV